MNKRRQAIYNKTGGHCAYCGCKLHKGWHADHVNPIYRNDTDQQVARFNRVRGLDTIENLMPACPRCNIRKHTLTVEGFRREISKQVDRLTRDNSAFRLASDYGLVKETGKEVIFFFEKD